MLWTLSATDGLLCQTLTAVVLSKLYGIYHCVEHESVAKITIKSMRVFQKTEYVSIQMCLQTTTVCGSPVEWCQILYLQLGELKT